MSTPAPLHLFATSLVLALAFSGCPGPAARDAGLDSSLDATDARDVPPSLDALLDVAPPRYVMPSCDHPATAFAPIATRCQNFVDAQGRVVYLHGINARVAGVFDVTFTDGRMPLEAIPPLTSDDTARMRALGYNLLRLPVNWSALEPTDSGHTQLDPTYLANVHAAVDLARRAGIYVLIDFHQDAYSKEIGEDGAPLWAIQPPPTMVLGGPLSDLGTRRNSSQVLAAFATFFGDAEPGPSLRARFASMAAQVATSFVGDAAVIGYEIYNEPVADDPSVQRLNAAVAASIRAADPGHLVFFEPSATRNVLDLAPLAPSPFPVAGGVYAPHIYTDSFTSVPSVLASFTRESLRTSHLRAAQEATSWGTPMLVTEWGYGPNGTRAPEYFAFQTDIQDEFGESDAFWLWKERSQGSWGLFDYDASTDTWTERVATRQALARVMPEAVAGWPETFAYDRVARRFELHDRGDASVTAPTRVYVPAPEDFAAQFDVTCDGATVTAPRDATTGLVDVPCGGAGEHTVVVTAR